MFVEHEYINFVPKLKDSWVDCLGGASLYFPVFCQIAGNLFSIALIK